MTNDDITTETTTITTTTTPPTQKHRRKQQQQKSHNNRCHTQAIPVYSRRCYQQRHRYRGTGTGGPRNNQTTTFIPKGGLLDRRLKSLLQSHAHQNIRNVLEHTRRSLPSFISSSQNELTESFSSSRLVHSECETATAVDQQQYRPLKRQKKKHNHDNDDNDNDNDVFRTPKSSSPVTPRQQRITTKMKEQQQLHQHPINNLNSPVAAHLASFTPSMSKSKSKSKSKKQVVLLRHSRIHSTHMPISLFRRQPLQQQLIDERARPQSPDNSGDELSDADEEQDNDDLESEEEKKDDDEQQRQRQQHDGQYENDDTIHTYNDNIRDDNTEDEGTRFDLSSQMISQTSDGLEMLLVASQSASLSDIVSSQDKGQE